jgi:hypothetical protein
MASETMEQWLLDPAPDPRDALIAALTEERDALLYACRVALAFSVAQHRMRGNGQPMTPGTAQTCETLRAAIARAEGREVAE